MTLKTFDADVPLEVQQTRGRRGVSTGRKHMHTKGPGRAANDRRKKQAASAKKKSREAAIHKGKVSAYFKGETDEFPQRS